MCRPNYTRLHNIMWNNQLKYAPSAIKVGLEAAESLPACSDQPLLCWSSLNRLHMYVGYHDAKNVSNLGGDPMKLKKTFYSIIYAVLRTRRSIAFTRSQFLRRFLRDHAQTAGVWKTVEEIRGHTSLSTALVSRPHPAGNLLRIGTEIFGRNI